MYYIIQFYNWLMSWFKDDDNITKPGSNGGFILSTSDDVIATGKEKAEFVKSLFNLYKISKKPKKGPDGKFIKWTEADKELHIKAIARALDTDYSTLYTLLMICEHQITSKELQKIDSISYNHMLPGMYGLNETFNLLCPNKDKYITLLNNINNYTLEK